MTTTGAVNGREVHAHAVMEMLMRAGGRRYSRASLAAAIRERFGAGARFYACSAAGMTAEELVELLAAKGKFSGPEDALMFDPARMCHGH